MTFLERLNSYRPAGSFTPAGDCMVARMVMRTGIVAAFLVQALLLAKAVWLYRERINPDAIVYLRIAGYYLNGQTDLMVAGGWGPLLSWLMIPWLLVFDDPLLAAHAAVASSAVVFLYGTYSLLRAMRLPDSAVVIGTWLTVFLSVSWSVAVITPDLLVDGIFYCGISMLLSGKWVDHAKTAFGAGLILGTAYLAKHIALPVSGLVVVALAVINLYRSSLRQTARAIAIFGVGFLLVAGPWVGLLSYKYGRPTFSTIGPIQHAIMGPPDMYRDHPDHRHFYKPEPGRITVLEDRANLPYNYWSPLESREYAVHQARLIWNNAHLILYFLRSFDWLGLGLISAIFGYLFFGTPWRKSLQEEPWRLSFIPIASVALIYLPVYAGGLYAVDVRYWWVTFPFLIAAGFGFTLHVSGAMSKHRAVQRALALALVTLSLIIGNEGVFRQAFSLSESASSAYSASKILANKLRAAGLIGSVAAVGPLPVDGRYVAYVLNVQSFGHLDKVDDLEEILSSGAALVIVPRGTTLARQLREDRRFASADKQLFGCDEANENPLEVFLTRPPTASDTCPESGPGH